MQPELDVRHAWPCRSRTCKGESKCRQHRLQPLLGPQAGRRAHHVWHLPAHLGLLARQGCHALRQPQPVLRDDGGWRQLLVQGQGLSNGFWGEGRAGAA
jgi:hypothetical protein